MPTLHESHCELFGKVNTCGLSGRVRVCTCDAKPAGILSLTPEGVTISDTRADHGPPSRNELGHWVKGQSGNPKGRKKGPSLVDALSKRLRINEATGDGHTVDDLAKRLLEIAFGNKDDRLSAVREIADRLDGKATQRTEVSGPDGDAIRVQANSVRERIAGLVGDVVEDEDGE